MTKQQSRTLAIGTRVFCTVHGIRGWYTLTGIRPRDGYIKVTGYPSWNPPHNFELADPNAANPIAAIQTVQAGVAARAVAEPAADDPTTRAREHLQPIPSELLAAAARGDLDLNALARQELGSRGLNWSGKWIGFDKARELAKCYPARRDGRVIAISIPE